MRLTKIFLTVLLFSCGAPENPEPKSRYIRGVDNLEGLPRASFYNGNGNNPKSISIRLNDGGLLIYHMQVEKKKLYLNLNKYKEGNLSQIYKGRGKFIQDLENIAYDKRDFSFKEIKSLREGRYFIEVNYSDFSLFKHILELDENGNILKKHNLIHQLKSYFWSWVKKRVVTKDNYLEIISIPSERGFLEVNIFDLNFNYLYTKKFVSRFLGECDDCHIRIPHKKKDYGDDFLLYNQAQINKGYSLYRLRMRNDRLDVSNLFGISHIKDQEYSTIVSLSNNRLEILFSEWDETKAKSSLKTKSLYSIDTPLRGDSNNLSKFKILKNNLDVNNRCIVYHDDKIYQIYPNGKYNVLDQRLNLIEQKKIRLEHIYSDYTSAQVNSHSQANLELLNCEINGNTLSADSSLIQSIKTPIGYKKIIKNLGHLSIYNLFPEK
ncbi:hypothetical protein N9N67_07580 [Bacteriovoracaceae bacterium]|nr:hypothetical protein [Bacteriovoracaceae bacterium]